MHSYQGWQEACDTLCDTFLRLGVFGILRLKSHPSTHRNLTTSKKGGRVACCLLFFVTALITLLLMLKTLMIYLYRTNAQISVKIYSVRPQTLR